MSVGTTPSTRIPKSCPRPVPNTASNSARKCLTGIPTSIINRQRLTLEQKIATKRKNYVAERRRLSDTRKQVVAIYTTIAELQQKLRQLCDADGDAASSVDCCGDALEPLAQIDCEDCQQKDIRIQSLVGERDDVQADLNDATDQLANQIAAQRVEQQQFRATESRYRRELAAAQQDIDAFAAQLQEVHVLMSSDDGRLGSVTEELRMQHEQEMQAASLDYVSKIAELSDEIVALKTANRHPHGMDSTELECDKSADNVQQLTTVDVRELQNSLAVHKNLLGIRSQLIVTMQAQEDAVRQQLETVQAVFVARGEEQQRLLVTLAERDARVEQQARTIRRMEKERSDHAALMVNVEERMALLTNENQRLREQFQQIFNCRNL